jgi:nitrate/nitrite transporter NarK
MILPSMKAGLSLSDVQAADIAVGNMIGYLLLSVISGLLASRFGSRVVITLSMLLISLSMLLTGLAAKYPVALLGRTLTGMGSGGVNVPVMALVAIWFAPQRRGLATGIAVSGSSIGLLITGFSIPIILKHFGPGGWRVAWYALAAAAMLLAVLCAFFLRNKPQDMGLAPVGSGRDSIVEQGRRTLQWRLVYKSPQVWHLAVLYMFFGISYVIYAMFFVRYLTGEAGFSIERAGRLWSLVGAISVASGFIWGMVSDRLGRKYGLALVFLLQAAAFSLFGLWRSEPGYLLSALFFALTAWSIPAIMAASVGDLLGSRLAPAAFGFISLFLSIGQVLGPFATGRIVEGTGSYSSAFVFAGAAALLGAVGSLLLRFPGRKL